MKNYRNRLFSFGGAPAAVILALIMFASGMNFDTEFSSQSYTSTESINGLAEYNGDIQPMNEDVDLTEDQVLVDNEVIKITAIGIDYDTYGGPSLLIEIENKTDEYITVQSRECQINGIALQPIMSDTVADKTTTVVEMSFEENALSIAGIEEFVTIPSKFVVLNPASFDRINETELGMCKTDSDYVQTYNDSGTVIYDDNNIKAVFHGVDYSDENIGPNMILYIENHNDFSVVVDVRDLMVNGVLADVAISSAIPANSRMYMMASYYYVTPAALGIKKAENFEFDLGFWSFGSDLWVNADSIIVGVE